ncbi:MAG: plastocyanin/azurin family copper-binding protein, partial [Bradymonadaceae bacterium]
MCRETWVVAALFAVSTFGLSAGCDGGGGGNGGITPADTGKRDTSEETDAGPDGGATDTDRRDVAQDGRTDGGKQDGGPEKDLLEDTAEKDGGGDTGGMDTGAGDTAEDVSMDVASAAVEEVQCNAVTADHRIPIVNNSFQMGDPTISAGDVVLWKNSDSFAHDVTAGENSGNKNESLFYSGRMGAGETFCLKFNKPDSYPYFCQIHGANTMSGTVTV